MVGDPACVVERFQNKVVFTVPLSPPTTRQSSSSAWFRLGVRAWSASPAELAAALGDGAAKVPAGSVGLDIEYETRVELMLKETDLDARQ